MTQNHPKPPTELDNHLQNHPKVPIIIQKLLGEYPVYSPDLFQILLQLIRYKVQYKRCGGLMVRCDRRPVDLKKRFFFYDIVFVWLASHSMLASGMFVGGF